jgi:hypothetical protein
LSFPGYFPFGYFTTYLEQPYGLFPGRPIAQALSIPHSPCVLTTNRKRIEGTPKYCEVFTQPQRQAYRTQHFWLEPPNFDCQGTDPFMPFALFTTLLGRVRLSQDNRGLFGILILLFLLKIAAKIANRFVNFRDVESPKINVGSPCIPTLNQRL